MKDRRPEWLGEPLIHRSNRSRSPLISYKRQQKSQMRSHRLSGHQSASRERRQERPLRRFDHGKGLIYDHSPLRDDGFGFQQNYTLPDHPSFNPSWKTSQTIDDRELHSHINEALPRSSLDIEEHGMLGQKSTYIGERSSRSLYLDHPMGSTVLSSDRMKRSGSSYGIGINEVEMHSYNDGLRVPYDDMDRRHVHSRDLSITNLPSSQLRAFNSTSSSSILKEEVKGLHRSPILDGLATGISRYPNTPTPLEPYAYNQVPKPDPLKHGLLDHSRIYDYDELQPRGPHDHQHRVQEEPYKKMHYASRTEFRNASSSTILDYSRDWMDKDDAANRNVIQRAFSEHYNYLHRDGAHDFDDMRARQDTLTYSGNWHGGLQIESSREYDRMPFEEGVVSEKDLFPISHRAEHRNIKSLLSDHVLDEHKLLMSAHSRTHMDGSGDYDSEWTDSRNYGIIGDIDGYDPRVEFMNGQRPCAPYESEEMWQTEEPMESSVSKSRLMEHSRYRKFSCGISKSDAFMLPSGASSVHAESDLNINIKRRLEHGHSDFHTSNFSKRKQDFSRSCKYWKRGRQDRLGAQGRGTHDSDAHVMKNDPPEGSDEFKQQVHKAFLRYSKLLNENQHNQRIYKTQGNAYSLLCSVCGSSSKKFVDTNSLVTHSYHSHKAGLKTEHLGFHKALCILLGWNWRVPPDNSRAYKSMLVAEAQAMRDDLILWPPLVIIHNILIGDNSGTKDAKVVTVESLEKMLIEMGFGAAKIRVCLGKPADQSIFTVKFTPTFSGFQAAETLHKHFADRNCSREEFRQISVHGKSGEKESQSKQADEFLYGYMAVAEDLDKLDPETKRRSLLKSKKDDVEAIADAPLSTD